MSKNIVAVIAAHPDDEILGCGAAVTKHSLRGDEVHVFIATEGSPVRGMDYGEEKVKSEILRFKNVIYKANEILGVKSVRIYGFVDQRMDAVDKLDIVKPIESFINEYKPNIVYTHFSGDVNNDHRLVNEAVITACRSTPNNCVKRLMFFETPSSTEWRVSGFFAAFVPNWFVDVSDTLDLKMKALREYNSEMRPYPHSRSYEAIESLSRWRGSTAGVGFAEAFVLGRNIE